MTKGESGMPTTNPIRAGIQATATFAHNRKTFFLGAMIVLIFPLSSVFFFLPKGNNFLKNRHTTARIANRVPSIFLSSTKRQVFSRKTASATHRVRLYQHFMVKKLSAQVYFLQIPAEYPQWARKMAVL